MTFVASQRLNNIIHLIDGYGETVAGQIGSIPDRRGNLVAFLREIRQHAGRPYLSSFVCIRRLLDTHGPTHTGQRRQGLAVQELLTRIDEQLRLAQHEAAADAQGVA